ncbi:MAG: hypothetical protein RSE41_09835 [Clostridia bacterium]
MKNRLIEFNGVDNTDEYSFKYRVKEKIQGNIEFKNKILTGATISKKCLNHKVLDGFEEINFDKIEIYNNILIINSKFELSIEYSDNNDFGKLSIYNYNFYKTFYTSLKDYNSYNLDITILITDFNILPLDDEIHYFATLLIGINDL